MPKTVGSAVIYFAQALPQDVSAPFGFVGGRRDAAALRKALEDLRAQGARVDSLVDLVEQLARYFDELYAGLGNATALAERQEIGGELFDPDTREGRALEAALARRPVTTLPKSAAAHLANAIRAGFAALR